WHRRNLPLWRRVFFAAKIASVWAFLIWERIGFARGLDGGARAQPGSTPQDNNFVFTGSRAIGSGNAAAAAVIDICLSEHKRRREARAPRPPPLALHPPAIAPAHPGWCEAGPAPTPRPRPPAGRLPPAPLSKSVRTFSVSSLRPTSLRLTRKARHHAERRLRP